MHLPELYTIEIGASKMSGYLLNPSHPLGWSKAKYFFEHGIISEDELRKILLKIISENEITETITTEFGSKFIVNGIIPPNMQLRTIWVVLKGENICKFVTAYPL